jgi:NAD(P)-dependent dehydrogenase (short-subunit alcohol dehydrogenase family)
VLGKASPRPLCEVRELRGRDITVNSVAPGPKRHTGTGRIANLVAFLISEDGHSVNGQVIRTDIGAA